MSVGATVSSAKAQLATLFRRAALVELAKAAAAYAPTSRDDASAARASVAGLIDAEIQRAADAGEDDVAAAFADLRAAVIQDLTVRGASLAPVRTFALGASLPAVVLAQRFYADPAREAELVRQAAPVHPLFMPARFQALAS